MVRARRCALRLPVSAGIEAYRPTQSCSLCSINSSNGCTPTRTTWRAPNWLLPCARRMVRRARQAVIQPASFGVRASLGRVYALIAWTGWRTFERDAVGWPMRLWWAQLALNFLWSPVFFAAHRIGLALVVILLLLAAILAFIALSWLQDRVSTWLFMPYAAWVAFASVRNSAILVLN